MSWQSIYQSRVRTADEAVEVIQSHHRIFLTGNVSVPKNLLAALVRRAPQLENVEICQALTIGPADYVSPEMEGHLRVNTMFISANVRKAVQTGAADFTPVLLSEFPLLFKNGILPLDVAMIHVSPPDEHGFCSLGLEVGLTKTAAESAKVIIAEVNEQMPRTLGDSFIHVSRLTHIVPVNYPIAEMNMSEEGDPEVVEKIAGFIADLIPDGATMQMGIGAIPDAVLKYLFHKKDLGVHSELFADGVIDLVEAGVLTNARKTLHTGKIVAGFILGSQRLYDWVDDNPLIELHRTEYINDPFVIAQNDRMVAINSAIEIDLTASAPNSTLAWAANSTSFTARRAPRAASPSSPCPASPHCAMAQWSAKLPPCSNPARASSPAATMCATSSPNTAWPTCTAKPSASAPRR